MVVVYLFECSEHQQEERIGQIQPIRSPNEGDDPVGPARTENNPIARSGDTKKVNEPAFQRVSRVYGSFPDLPIEGSLQWHQRESDACKQGDGVGSSPMQHETDRKYRNDAERSQDLAPNERCQSPLNTRPSLHGYLQRHAGLLGSLTPCWARKTHGRASLNRANAAERLKDQFELIGTVCAVHL